MIYRTKADLLGRLWKARSDVRLIDRMVGRGEVKKTDEWYELNENFFIKWVNEYDKNMIQDNTTYDKNITLSDNNLEDWQSDLDFQIAENERLIKEHEEEIKWIIDRCYNHMLNKRCLPYPTKKEFTYWAKGISIDGIDSDFRD